VGLGRAHGAERGHGTARERGESGVEGAGTGKKKERRRETLMSGPRPAGREGGALASTRCWAARQRKE